MTYAMDVELFISEVKKHPELWDIHCESYRFTNRKKAAWAEVANVFIPEIKDMSEKEKSDVYRKLHGKWRNIRDSFVRHIRKKDNKKGGYMYAKHLSFLNLLYKPSEEDWSDEDGRKNLHIYKTEKIDVDNWQSDGEYSLESVKRKRSKKDEEDVLDYVESPLISGANCSYQIEDEDKSFFDSLLPAVRSFDLDQKLEFRSQVICLVKNIRNGRNNISRNESKMTFVASE